MNDTMICNECGSLFFRDKTEMAALCPECAHILYGYPNCTHAFENGRCRKCHWDGSTSTYIRGIKATDRSEKQ